MTTIVLQPYASPIIALILAAIVIKRFAPLPQKKALIALCAGLLIVSGSLVILDIANASARRTTWRSIVPWMRVGPIDAGDEFVGSCGNEFAEASISLGYGWVNGVYKATDWIEVFFRDSHVPDMIYCYTNVTDSTILNFTPPYTHNNALLLAAWEVVVSNVNSSIPKTVSISVRYLHSEPLIHTAVYSYVYCGLIFLSTSFFGLLVNKKTINREAYSIVQKFALLNIAILGTLGALALSVILYIEGIWEGGSPLIIISILTPTALFLLIIVWGKRIKKEKEVYSWRERFNREGYTRTEKFALLNILTIGLIIVTIYLTLWVGMFLIEGRPMLTPSELVFSALRASASTYPLPFLLYGCILALGKKIKEVEPDCQESTEQIATHNGNR